MKVNDLLPGSKVDIRIVQLEERETAPDVDQSVYYSTIFDVTDDGVIEVNMPTIAGKLQLLQKHIRYEFIFKTPSGMYKAEGTVIDHIKREGFYLLRIEIGENLTRFQRRQYFRLECMIPIMFMGLTEGAATQETIEEVKRYMDALEEMKIRGMGTMLDISGGGTRFVTSNSLAGVKYLLIQFQLQCQKELTEIEVVGEVLSSEKAKDGEKFVHRIKFFFRDNQSREQIISYVFEEERRLRKREQGL